MALKKTKQVEAMLSKLDDVRIFFEEMAAKRQESYDNKSDKWQESEKGEEEQENISSIEDITNDIQTAYDNAENLFEE